MFVFLEDSEQKVKGKGSLISIGSLWLTQESLKQLVLKVLGLRFRYNCWGEFKYQKIDKTHIEVYKEFLDIFLELDARLNIITMREPSAEILKKYHGGDKKTCQMKMIYNLIYHTWNGYKGGFCKDKELYIIADEPFLQRGTDRETLLKILSYSKGVPVKYATNTDSRIIDALQMIDMLTGLTLNYVSGVGNSKSVPLIDKLKSVRHLDLAIFRKEANSKIHNWFYQPNLKSL